MELLVSFSSRFLEMVEVRLDGRLTGLKALINGGVHLLWKRLPACIGALLLLWVSRVS